MSTATLETVLSKLNEMASEHNFLVLRVKELEDRLESIGMVDKLARIEDLVRRQHDDPHGRREDAVLSAEFDLDGDLVSATVRKT